MGADAITTEDALERHIDLVVGVVASAWAITALFVPQLSVLASPYLAGPFALVALGRWRRKMSARKGSTPT